MELEELKQYVKSEGYYFGRLIAETKCDEAQCLEVLYSLVGRKEIYLTDMYFRWSKDQRDLLQKISDGEVLRSRLVEQNLYEYDLSFFPKIRSKQVFLNDLFSLISLLERRLHLGLFEKLRETHEHDWWRKGIPTEVRVSMGKRYEEDDSPLDNLEDDIKEANFDRYCYSNFINLDQIIRDKRNWNDLVKSGFIPEVYRNDPKKLGRQFTDLNDIRNMIMHPVKRYKYTEKMFSIIKQVMDDFNINYT